MLGLFMRAVAVTAIGLGSICRAFWDYAHPKTLWAVLAPIELYGGIFLVCVGLFVGIRNYRRMRKAPPRTL
jgi:hypothetical protein